MALPVKGEAYTFYVSLVDAADSTSFLADPTIVTGDFQISQDGGAFANLTNLPVSAPSGSIQVAVNLTATEMDASKVSVFAQDQSASAEWFEVLATIDVGDASAESVQDILEGDHTETNARLTITNKTSGATLIDKDISGSLLADNVTITTTER